MLILKRFLFIKTFFHKIYALRCFKKFTLNQILLRPNTGAKFYSNCAWKRECLTTVRGHPLRIVWMYQVRWRQSSLKCKGGIKHSLDLIGSLELRVCCLYVEEPINQMHTKQPSPCKHVGHTYVALGSAHTHFSQCNFVL